MAAQFIFTNGAAGSSVNIKSFLPRGTPFSFRQKIVKLGGTPKAGGLSSDTAHARQKKSATSTNAFAAMDGVSPLNDQCKSLVRQVLNNGLCRSTRKPIKA